MTGKAYGECLTMIRAIHSAVSPVVTKEYAGPCCSHCEWRRDGAEACLGPVCYKRAFKSEKVGG